MTDGMRQMHGNIRVEKVVWKDIKLRTFISDVGQRNDLAAHVYDVSYGSLRPYEDKHSARASSRYSTACTRRRL